MRKLKLFLKQAFAPLIYKGYPVTLQIERLYLWLDVLARTQDLQGDVVEIGVMHGGTSIIGRKFLKRTGSSRQYWAMDTFSGFVESQIEKEIEKGLSSDHRSHFQVNSAKLVKKIFAIHNVSDINVVEGDIAAATDLPVTISAALIDVDLEEPTFAALTRVYERLDDKGVIMVDDCHRISEGFTHYRADEAVRRFAQEHELYVVHIHNCALISKQEPYQNAYLESEDRGFSSRTLGPQGSARKM